MRHRSRKIPETQVRPIRQARDEHRNKLVKGEKPASRLRLPASVGPGDATGPLSPSEPERWRIQDNKMEGVIAVDKDTR